ncbi:MAG: amidohydrolase [Candidatus Bipolaricaulaceae bacterium]
MLDLIVQGGPIFGHPEADAVGVRCGRIAAVGRAQDLAALRGPKTQVFRLEGRPLLPGFFDAHLHFLKIGLDRTFFVDLSQTRTLSEAVELLRARAKERPGEWVVGRGWDESRWPERRYLERADLDRAVPRQPCCAVRVDGHMMVANTLALARCVRPEGELVDRERGFVFEDAIPEVLALVRPSQEALVEAVAEASRYAASLGVTAAADMDTDAQALRAYALAEHRGLLRTRLFAYVKAELLPHLASLGIRKGFGSAFLRLAGVKAFADGSIGAKTAALFEPYRGEMGKGRVLLGRGELARLWRKVMEAELQLAVHAIGDRAIEEVLAAARLAGVGALDRHRVEHLELPTPHQLDRLKELGLVASMQPNFLQWSGPGRMYEDRLGPARDARIDPHRWVLDRGIPLAFGSDGMPLGPLYGIGLALDPPYYPQRVTWEEAIRAYTYGAAYAAFAEEELGSLEVGRWADFVVLSGDPSRTPPKDLRVEATFVAGELAFSR